jgi:hypothetical protein
MTVGDWLASRRPAPPDSLAARLRAILGPALGEPADRACAELLAAAERALAAYLPRCGTDGDDALDLLAVDALVTYALEAGAEHDGDVAETARRAMARLAALAPAAA